MARVSSNVSCCLKLKSSDFGLFFKIRGNQVRHTSQSVSTMDYSRFLNDLSKGRQPSSIRELTKLITSSSQRITNLGGGFPNTDMYPFSDISATMKDGTKIVLEGELLAEALQYGPSEGYPKLVALMTDFQERLHKPPKEVQRSIAVTTGAQDAMCKTFEMLLTPGDFVIAEEYLYPGVVSILRPYHVKHLKVKGDADGIKPESLLEVLKPFGNPKDFGTRTGAVPKVLYVIPNGGNPVGTSVSAERRKQIYKIAQEYNLLIIEDDPYYFIDFVEVKAPSFLSLDVDGRVIRFDSFSKVISGGLRLGLVTGPAPLVRQLILHVQVSVLHTPSANQIIMYQLLSKWGFEGFMGHTKKVAEFYKSRRDFTNATAKKWLDGLAEWNLPLAGMFLWIRILGVEDSYALVTEKLLPRLVAFLPGRVCTMDNSNTPFIRISFSFATDKEIDEAFRKLAEGIREEIGSASTKTQTKG